MYTWTEDQQASARLRATGGGDIHRLGIASRVDFARMVTHYIGGTDLSSLVFSPSLVAVRRFVSHHIEGACDESSV